MTDITIPPEALEAAVKAYFATKKDSYEGWINDACLAMLKAWPGMEYMMGDEAFPFHHLILPLPKEASDEPRS